MPVGRFDINSKKRLSENFRQVGNSFLKGKKMRTLGYQYDNAPTMNDNSLIILQKLI
jgi:hypothetical protein